MKFSVFQLSRKGGRAINEDRMGYCYTRDAALFVLADGMGGHPEGEVAAQLALQSMSLYFQRQAKPHLADMRQFLIDALLYAHQHILRYASGRGMLETPRTTLVAAVVQKGRAAWIHCGDSRLYHVRDGQLVVRTRDHSYLEMAELAAQVKLVNRNVLFTCLGSPATPIYDVTEPAPLKRGDKLLLCSDGLWGSLQESQILNTLSTFPVSRAVPWLIDGALDIAGASSDNVTAIAMEWQAASNTSSFGISGISTNSIAANGFESTIVQTGKKDDDFFDSALDDASIERSIAEINEAIRRSTKPKGGR